MRWLWTYAFRSATRAGCELPLSCSRRPNRISALPARNRHPVSGGRPSCRRNQPQRSSRRSTASNASNRCRISYSKKKSLMAISSNSQSFRDRTPAPCSPGSRSLPAAPTGHWRSDASDSEPRNPVMAHVLASHTQQRGIVATGSPALLRSRGRPSHLHNTWRKCSALPAGPTERGGPPPLLGLSPGLCGPGGTAAYLTHRTVKPPSGSLKKRKP